ncbi:TPA: DNA-binding protein [Candidatus Taylorbacteria bacterium]|nr:DNA-binding protein [Candidatus Taylorbacteria bacterium]
MSKKSNSKSLIPEERIEQIIFIIRNKKVILDSDLAALYGVEVKRLNEAAKRNIGRFPNDFRFQLTQLEVGNLKSQFATSSYGGRRKLPYAFTEHGALMAANVLNSERAVAMSVAIVRTFIKLRRLLSVNKDLVRRLNELEEKYDEQFQVVFVAIKRLMELPEEPEKPKIGFHG